MISYGPDGMTLNYTNAAGQPASASIFDGAVYSDLLVTMDLQKSVARDNQTAFNNYAQTVANAQQAINAGQTYPPLPPPPKQENISDTDVVTFTTFANLPTLTQPTVRVAPSLGTFPAAPTVDKQAIMYNMIVAIYNKLFPPAQGS